MYIFGNASDLSNMKTVRWTLNSKLPFLRVRQSVYFIGVWQRQLQWWSKDIFSRQRHLPRQV